VVTDILEIKEKRLDKKLIRKQQETLRKVKEMMEVNPMLGHRGVRLGITYPEIYQMQIQAILEAAAELLKEGVQVQPEIMVPQVCTAQELKWVYQLVKKIQKGVEKQYEIEIPFKFGTMIEVVRACMRAGRLAEVADFFSFGTNDLTQYTLAADRGNALVSNLSDALHPAVLRLIRQVVEGATGTAAVEHEVRPARITPGTYRNITGNSAVALGFVAAARRPACSRCWPATPITVTWI
jgi:phosphoenolpyruvate-protein kinase (PTS system EI component)